MACSQQLRGKNEELSPWVSPGLLYLQHFRIGALHHLSIIPILVRNRLRPPVQLFKPIVHLTPARFASIAMFTVGAVDSQQGHQAADSISQGHNPTSPEFGSFPRGRCVPCGGNYVPTLARVRLRASNTRSFSANTRARSTWGSSCARQQTGMAILPSLHTWDTVPS